MKLSFFASFFGKKKRALFRNVIAMLMVAVVPLLFHLDSLVLAESETTAGAKIHVSEGMDSVSGKAVMKRHVGIGQRDKKNLTSEKILCPAYAVRRFASRYAEVEIELNEELGISDIEALPLAPESEVRFSRNPDRAVAQLPEKVVRELLEHGVEVKVLRPFILVVGHSKGSDKLKELEALDATYPGTPEEGSNSANIAIPNGSGAWVYSEILINAAPSGAVVTCVDVHYEIVHTYVGDLTVDLSDETLSYEYRLWDEEGGSSDDIVETETGITVFSGELVNQFWLLWAQDTRTQYSGYIDYWWIKVYHDGGSSIPENNNCAEAIPVTEGVTLTGSTVRATGSYESCCSVNDRQDVWYSFTPSSTAAARISLAGSSFDTTLAVFDTCDGTVLACNDDANDSLESELVMNMAAGETYLIRIAGYDGDVGLFSLLVDTSPCVMPHEPDRPIPGDQDGDVSSDTSLAWSGSEAYGYADKARTVDTKSKTHSPKVIYGADDRLEEYQVDDPDTLLVGDATVAIVPCSDLIDNLDGTYSLTGLTFAEWYLSVDPIETGNSLCSDEPYRDQPNPAFCSGFLVAPDVVATAGHCMESVEDGGCFVFNFVMLDATTPNTVFDASDIYTYVETLDMRDGCSDWGLVRLDREVTGHQPVSLRSTGAVSEGDPLLIIGHPTGLPRKYADGATVQQNDQSSYFSANLDSYSGNSGSAVFNATSLEVEGILVSGAADFKEDFGCDRSNVCPNSGCPESLEMETVTRTAEFYEALTRYDVYLDTTYPPEQLVAADLYIPIYESEGSLPHNTTFFWQIVSKNSCNEFPGPVWSFQTESCVDNDQDGYTENDDCDDTDVSVFPGADEICDGKDNDCDGLIDEGCLIGDIDGNGTVDLMDAIIALQIVGGSDLNDQNISFGADCNNDGVIGIAEAIYVLEKVVGNPN